PCAPPMRAPRGLAFRPTPGHCRAPDSNPAHAAQPPAQPVPEPGTGPWRDQRRCPYTNGEKDP
ncbi:hypothetical protein ACFW9F_18635, partial [Streptomyces sp. NPDC059506]